jgi:HD-GYP domain-containing protein (c-di-GMP phosphodiesterase class II)
MLRVPVNKITPGMVLARPIPLPNEPYRFLLQRDREIPMDVVPRLKQLGVLEVWVRYRNLEFLEDIIDQGLGERQREVYAHVRENFEQIMHGAAAQLDVGQFTSSISGLFNYLKESARANILLSKLDAFDNYLMSHSTNVCYLALLLGMHLERYLIEERSRCLPRDAKDLKELGLGCILHDVGKMLIPPEVLNKPGKLTPEEREIVERHPTYGYDMVRGRVPAPAAQVVLNHHQRYGGGGYPARVDQRSGEVLPALRGRQIPIFCRITTVCDVFDAATTNRCYSRAKTYVEALHEMRTSCAPFFDPMVLDAFCEIIPAFPLGQVVTLSSGAEAVVVDFNPRHALRPKVQCIRDTAGCEVADPTLHEYDLAIHLDLDIVEVNGRDVRAFTVIEPQLCLA